MKYNHVLMHAFYNTGVNKKSRNIYPLKLTINYISTLRSKDPLLMNVNIVHVQAEDVLCISLKADETPICVVFFT